MKSADKAQAFRRPLVVSLLGSDLSIQRSGITIFESKHDKVAVPEWRLDEMLENITAQRLKQEGIAAQVANPSLRAAIYAKIWSPTLHISDMAFGGFIRNNKSMLGDADSIVFIYGHPGKAMAEAQGSFPPALVNFTFADRITYCGTIRVNAHAIPDGRQLSWAHGNDSGTYSEKAPFHSWAELTPASRDAIRKRIVDLMQQSLREALTRAGI